MTKNKSVALGENIGGVWPAFTRIANRSRVCLKCWSESPS